MGTLSGNSLTWFSDSSFDIHHADNLHHTRGRIDFDGYLACELTQLATISSALAPCLLTIAQSAHDEHVALHCDHGDRTHGDADACREGLACQE